MLTMRRFILITIPPPETAAAIDAVRWPLNMAAASRAALAYPPHVTLRTGFLVPDEAVNLFLTDFSRWAVAAAPAKVRTCGLYCGTYAQDEGPRRIICYRVAEEQSLLALNRHLLGFAAYRKSNRTAFWPHLTLAYEDLTEEGYTAACRWLDAHPETAQQIHVWLCDRIWLFEQESNYWWPKCAIAVGSDEK